MLAIQKREGREGKKSAAAARSLFPFEWVRTFLVRREEGRIQAELVMSGGREEEEKPLLPPPTILIQGKSLRGTLLLTFAFNFIN